jgi:uncharacterized protein
MSTNFANLPGVKIQEVRLGAPPIAGVGTSTAGFVGKSPLGTAFLDTPHLVTSLDQFTAEYIKTETAMTNLAYAVRGFFQNGGTECYVVNVNAEDKAKITGGLARLEAIEEIDIIAAPGITDKDVYKALQDQAKNTGNRFAILDPPASGSVGDLIDPTKLRPADSQWSAFYFPQIQVARILANDPPTETEPIFVGPSGHIAGLYARVDGQRGVHKAPANEQLMGALAVKQIVTDDEQNKLNEEGVDVIRLFSAGPVVWGARTLENKANLPFRYISVRRLTTYIEQSLRAGLRFAVFEPNNLALRQTITRSVRGFLDGVWRDGALFGATADEAYYVRFPDTFNRDEDRAQGKLTLEVGIRVAPPAEFIIIRIGLLDRAANAT